MWKKSLIFIHTAVVLTSCGNKKQDKHENVFYYNEDAGITSLDPAFAKDQAQIWAVNQVFNGLVQMDDSLHITPCLAKSWTISPDGKTYTFNLRSDILFHENEVFSSRDERKLTAHDAVYSLARICDPLTASPGAWIFNDKTDKFSALRKGDRTIGYVNTDRPKSPPPFHAPDDSTVVINLNKPFPAFLGLLTMPYCNIVSRKAAERYGADFRSNPVGTGPFSFRYWDEGVKLVLQRNPDYFEYEGTKRLPYLDAVCISFVENKQTAFMEFASGKLDFFNGLEGSYKDELLTGRGELKSKYREKFILETAPQLNTEFIAFLVDDQLPIVQSSPTRLKKVRQAISLSINRKEMLKYLRNSIGNPDVNGFVPEGLPKGSPRAVQAYDPEKARQLLAEAGFPEGKGLAPITLNTVPTYLDLAIYMQKQLAQTGINLKINVNQPPALREAKSKSQILLFRGSWIADYPDAENYLATFYSGNFSPDGPNYCHFRNEAFDRLYEEAYRTINDSLRYTLYARMEEILMDETPVVVLYYDKFMRVYQKNISGLPPNPMNWLILKRVKKHM